MKTTSNFAFIDSWFEGFKSGLGVSFLNQKESGSSYTFNQVNLNFAMAFEISDTWYFRPSISAGLGTKNYGFQNLLLEDQIDVNVTVKERNSGQFTFGLGYSQVSGLNFSTSVSLQNLLGTGNTLSVAVNTSDSISD